MNVISKRILLFLFFISCAGTLLPAQETAAPNSAAYSLVRNTTEDLGIKLAAEGVIIAQYASSRGLVEWENKERRGLGGSAAGNYYLKLNMSKEFENGAKIVSRIMGGIGDGVNRVIDSYSTIGDPYNSKELKIDRLYYLQPLFNDKLNLRFGKFSADYFDKSTEDMIFVNALFTISPVISILGGRIGASAIYSPYDFLDLEYGYFVRDEYDQHEGKTVDNIGDISAAGWTGGDINIKPFQDTAKEGNYRIGIWNNNDKKGFFSFVKNSSGGLDLKPQTTWGFQLSAEQKLWDRVILFGKYTNAVVTAARPNDGTNVNISPAHTNDYFFTQNPVLKRSWVLGVILYGDLWGRTLDSIGAAVGQVVPDKSWAEDVRIYHPHRDPLKTDYDADYDTLWSNFKADRETVVEVYYLFGLNKNISIIPLVQFLHNPYGGNAVDSDNKAVKKLFVAGAKMAFSF
jgi:carbohydrate-selective porin OprB